MFEMENSAIYTLQISEWSLPALIYSRCRLCEYSLLTLAQKDGKSERPAAVDGTGDSNGKSSQKSKRSLAAEKKKLEAEQDAIEPAKATDQHLERCTTCLLEVLSDQRCMKRLTCSWESISENEDQI